MDTGGVLGYFLAILLYIDRVACSSLSVEECRSLGFVTTDLICGACDELDQFNLSTLKESCLKCCQKEDTENEALKVYPYAELHVCN